MSRIDVAEGIRLAVAMTPGFDNAVSPGDREAYVHGLADRILLHYDAIMLADEKVHSRSVPGYA